MNQRPSATQNMMARYTGKLLATTALFASLHVSSSAFAAEATMSFTTAKANEITALQVRVLQSEMMVAALQCDLRPQYNEIVRTYQGEIGTHGKHMRTYFERTYGRGGEKELNSFVTEMANRASRRAVSLGSHYCIGAKSLMTEILSLPAKGLKLADAGSVSVNMATYQVETTKGSDGLPKAIDVAAALGKPVISPPVQIAAAHPSLAKEQAQIERAEKKAEKEIADTQAAALEVQATADRLAQEQAEILSQLLTAERRVPWLHTRLHVPLQTNEWLDLNGEDLSALASPLEERPFAQLLLALKKNAPPVVDVGFTQGQKVFVFAGLSLGILLYLMTLTPVWRRRKLIAACEK